MALTPEQEQRRLELIQEQNKAAKELASTYEKMAQTVGRLNVQDQETLSIAKQISKYSSEIEKSTKKRTDKTASLVNLFSNLNRQQNNYKNNLEASQKTQTNLTKQYQESVKANSQLLDQIDKENKLNLKASALADSARNRYQELLRARERGETINKRDLVMARRKYLDLTEEIKVSDKVLAKLQEKQKAQEDYTKQIINTKKAHEAVLAQQKKEVELARKALANNAIDTAYRKLQLDQFRSIEGIYAFIVKAGFKVNEQTTQLGKSLGISYNAADKIRSSFASYVRNNKDAFINTERLVKAQISLTEQLGIAVQFSNEELETFSRLTEIVGLTAQEAGNIAKFSAAAGMENRDYVKSIRSAALFSQQANRIHISDKELLTTIGKLSAGILVKFQNNPKALAEAVIQAKKLGTSLEQIDKVAESLLNFESSIGAELEAELITGKQLNFERARAAALTGDQATLMQEMAAQAGSLAEFQDMNVIAQQSLAKAFGMSRDEMADMLMKQEAINKYGDKAADLNAQQLKDFQKSGLSLDDYLEKQAYQLNAQEKFNNAVTKLQDIIGNLVGGPFGKLLGMLADFVGMLSTAAGWVAAIGESFNGVTGILIGLIPILSKASFIAKAFALKGLQGAIAAIFRSFAVIPAGFGIPLAIAAVAGLTSLFSSKGDDVMSEGGYGNRTLLTKKGAIKLNNQDTVLAGTDLFGKNKRESNNSEIIAAFINKLGSSVAPSPTPQFSLVVDGQRLGSVVGNQQSTGTEQTKNAYRLA